MCIRDRILTDNGWEFSRPEDIEYNYKTGERLINIFYTESYSSWQKGGIEPVSYTHLDVYKRQDREVSPSTSFLGLIISNSLLSSPFKFSGKGS